MSCFECGSAKDLQQHHVVPRSVGGTKTVTLCQSCHDLVHGVKKLSISELTKLGLKRRREKGLPLGAPQKHNEALIKKLGATGLTYPEICKVVGCSKATVSRHLRRQVSKWSNK